MSVKRKFLHRQIWYVKRGDAVEGPFPARLVSRYILVGRIKPDHQLSVDGRVWEPVSAFPELMPEVLQLDQDDPEARQRLMAAIRWEDERSGRDRRSGKREVGEGETSRRRGNDRRGGEAVDNKAARDERLRRTEQENRARKEQDARARSRYRWQAAVLTIVAGVAIIGGLFLIPPRDLGSRVDCGVAPRPGVNWSLCQMEGRQLKGVDLTDATLRSVNFTGANLSGASLQAASAAFAVMSSANLTGVNFRRADLTGVGFRNARLTKANFDNANLAYADFAGADLTGVSFAGAILDKAIWFDWRVCAEGSIGECK